MKFINTFIYLSKSETPNILILLRKKQSLPIYLKISKLRRNLIAQLNGIFRPEIWNTVERAALK